VGQSLTAIKEVQMASETTIDFSMSARNANAFFDTLQTIRDLQGCTVTFSDENPRHYPCAITFSLTTDPRTLNQIRRDIPRIKPDVQIRLY